MTPNKTINIIFLFILFSGLTACRKTIVDNDYLVSFKDTIKDGCGYKNSKGEIVIPEGKYAMCITDTFKTYAIVGKSNVGIIGIDRKENTMYKVFVFDNGPDEPSDGLFRIMVSNKIGYADAATGAIIIKPQFDCAWPFEHGVAKVSNDCKTEMEGEHSSWVSDHWFYINTAGKKVKSLE